MTIDSLSRLSGGLQGASSGDNGTTDTVQDKAFLAQLFKQLLNAGNDKGNLTDMLNDSTSKPTCAAKSNSGCCGGGAVNIGGGCCSNGAQAGTIGPAGVGGSLRFQ